MQNLLFRAFEASSWAGMAGIIHALGELVATGGMSPTAWGTLAAGIAAVLIPEAPRTPKD